MMINTDNMIDIGDRIVRENTSQGARIAIPRKYTDIRYNRYEDASRGIIVLVPYERW